MKHANPGAASRLARETTADRPLTVLFPLLIACLFALAAACSEPDIEERPVEPNQLPITGNTASAKGEGMPAQPAAGLGGSGAGRYRRLPVAEFSDDQRRQYEELRSIGYLDGSMPAKANVGVTIHDESRVEPGLLFYTSGHEPGAFLTDRAGNVLHEWHRSFHDVWPDFEFSNDVQRRNMGFWRRAYIQENGDVVALFEGSGLIRVDRDSRLLWAVENGAHHAADIQPNGDIYLLAREPRLIPEVNRKRLVLDELVLVLGPNGEEKRRLSLVEAALRSPLASGWITANKSAGELFHSNSLEVLDGRLAHVDPAFRRGNLLISARSISTVFVVDPDRGEIVWVYRDDFVHQHDARTLDNQHLLLFDNSLKNSRVLEIELATREAVWSYSGTSEEPFFSFSCGTAQRLENNNTLITESDTGRAFEITVDGEIVWEFISAHRAGANEELVATLFDVQWLPPDFPLGWLR